MFYISYVVSILVLVIFMMQIFNTWSEQIRMKYKCVRVESRED